MSITSDHWNTVFHDTFQECLNAIKKVHSSHLTQYPKSLRIIGTSGVGKTNLIEEMERLYPRTEDDAGARIPVLRAEIPASPTEKTLLIELLRALGDPLPALGTRGVMEIRLLTLLRNARAELLLIDESHHFVVNGSRVSLNAAADMFKSLVNKARLPIVMFGMRSARELFFMSAQLRSRIPLELELRAFNWDEPKERGQFLGVFKAQFGLGFENDTYLFVDDVARRLWYATSG